MGAWKSCGRRNGGEVAETRKTTFFGVAAVSRLVDAVCSSTALPPPLEGSRALRQAAAVAIVVGINATGMKKIAFIKRCAEEECIGTRTRFKVVPNCPDENSRKSSGKISSGKRPWKVLLQRLEKRAGTVFTEKLNRVLNSCCQAPDNHSTVSPEKF